MKRKQRISRLSLSIQIIRNLALLYYLKGQLDVVIRAYQLYLSRAQEDDPAHYNRDLLYMTKRMRTEANAEVYNAARYLSPDDAESATNLGMGYFFCGDLKQAVALFRKALQFDPSFVQARYQLGVAYNTAGQPEKAIPIFEKLLQAQPDNPSLQFNLDLVYHDTDLQKKAIACFHQVIAMNKADSFYGQKARQALKNF